jgi:hypothetical protein
MQSVGKGDIISVSGNFVPQNGQNEIGILLSASQEKMVPSALIPMAQ